MAQAVADASPLIALSQIGELSLLEQLFGKILIPSAVAREVSPSLPRLPAWIETRALERPLDARVVNASLDPGESEAISLALETGAERVILDDRRARRLALDVGLMIVGTAAVVYAAKRSGLIPAVRPLLDALRQANFHLRKDVYQQILEAAGEVE